jgi:CubicO group peptidase (beta-lactamase class C family)
MLSAMAVRVPSRRRIVVAAAKRGQGMVNVRARWISFFALIVMVALAAGGGAADLPRASPEELGFSATRLDDLDLFFEEKVQRGEMAGIVTLVARHGKIAHFTAVGYADLEKKRKMQTDTLFRLYSMTKPFTSAALMMLYQDGRFQLSDPLSKYIPEFANLRVLRSPDAALDDTVAPVHAPTIQDAMRHTAGFTHGLGTDAYDTQYTQAHVFGLEVTLAQMMGKLSRIPLRYQPGTQFVYSVGPDVQARLVEVLSGMPFEEFLQKRLFNPLGMKDAGFWVAPEKANRLATVYWAKDSKLQPLDDAHGHPPGGILVEPILVNSYTANHSHKGGSFGLVSTAEDYWRFAQMMLNGGELQGTRVLAPRVVRYMARDHLGTIRMEGPGDRPSGLGFGLGFAVIRDPAAVGYLSSEGTYFWFGAANTHFWIDPKEDLIVVAMTQQMGGGLGMESLLPQLRTLVYSALLD